MEESKYVWSTADIIKDRNNWTLASDVELLKHIRSLSEKFVNRSRSTLNLLNSFENDVNGACTSVANVNNRFRALSDTQFVENKVRDDSPEGEDSPVKLLEKGSEISENITGKLNEALSNGIHVLRTQYDIIAVTDSDSEEDEPQEVLLKSRNPFMSRRLPYIIGSEEFSMHDHLGLVTSSEDEDDEKESEVEDDEDEDDISCLRKDISKFDTVRSDVIQSRTQVIQVSSDSEDSEVSFSGEQQLAPENSRNDTDIHNANARETSSIPSGFADHLNATMRNIADNAIPPLIDDMYSAPPLPRMDDKQSVSDDERSNSDSDIFVPSKKKEPQIKPNKLNVNALRDEISRKSSIASDMNQPIDVTLPPKSVNVDLPRNAYGDKSTANMFNALNAELSRKFNQKVVTKDKNENDSLSSHSTDSHGGPSIVGSEKSSLFGNESENVKEVLISTIASPSSHTENTSSTISKNKSPLLISSVTSPNSVDEDIFSSSTSKCNSKSFVSIPKKSISKPKVISLFDDDDSMDDLFTSKSNSKNLKTIPTLSSNINKSSEGLLNHPDDLFQNEEVRERKTFKKPVTEANTNTSDNLFRKVDLFNEDSDSGDDIFAIIKNQKKTSVSNIATQKTEERPLLIEEDDGMFEKENSVRSPRQIFASKDEKTKKMSNMSEINDVPKRQNVRKNISNVEFGVKDQINEKLKNTEPTLFDSDNEGDDLFAAYLKKDNQWCSTSSHQNLHKFAKESSRAGQSGLESHVFFTNDISGEEKLLKSVEDGLPSTDTLLKTTLEPALLARTKFFENSSKEKQDLFVSSEKSESEVVKDLLKSNTHAESQVLSASKIVNALSHQLERSAVPAVLSDVIEDSASNKIIRNSTSTTKSPAKLAANRCPNINVRTLLPGSNWSSITKLAKANNEKTLVGDASVSTNQAESNSEERSNHLSTVLAKERLKVSVKRRPPSRRARLNKALASDIFATNAVTNINDVEPDIYQTTTTEEIIIGKGLLNLNETKEGTISSFVESTTPPDSTKCEKERDGSSETAEEQSSTIVPENRTNMAEEGMNGNKIARNLGNILITASGSREPPAMLQDSGSILNDSDKDDDTMDEVIGENKHMNDPIPGISEEDRSRNANISPLVPVLQPSLTEESNTSRALFEKIDPVILSPKSTTSSVSNVSVSDTLRYRCSSTNSETPEKLTSPIFPDLLSETSKIDIESELSKRTAFSAEPYSPVENDCDSDRREACKKSGMDLFSFDEDNSDDDLDKLVSKVMTPKILSSTIHSASGEDKSSIKAQISSERNSASSRSYLFFANDDKKDHFVDFETSVKSRAPSSDHSSISSKNNEGTEKSGKISNKINTDLFADDDDDDALFSSNKESSIGLMKASSRSLFEEDDDDDDNLFGCPVSLPSTHKKSTETSKTVKPSTSAAKVRVVKLRSQAVEIDPLTGRTIEK